MKKQNKFTENIILKKNKNRNKLTKLKIYIDSDDELDTKLDKNENIDSDADADADTNSVDSDSDSVNNPHLITNAKLAKYQSETIIKYIVKDKIQDFNSKSILCYFLWSGIDDLDRWELNRKIDTIHVKNIYKEMCNDYKNNGEFIFYEHVHLAIKPNKMFYVIDGQHRLIVCDKLCKKNKYPIQQIPCVIWFPESDKEFIEIFDKINSRTPIDKTKLFNYKIADIISWMDKNLGNNKDIWGKNRPKINKDLFVEKMRQNNLVHKLETNELINKINDHNILLRGLSRTKRYDKPIVDSIHNSAETMDFYLGYDKELNWIEELS